ncbi:PREDICTED: uncharacterized protein LOC105956639 isoform X2 [Erythranthe guttata]|uniref:uncharacterized protein LOC105956639 isoform X2 n=1 Tax=Erythranthe guttata TaxID=4155 RepID=UPI00064DD855|nr:PREDICTED: uncharacterized protein LOC105956639 isoform X2 [Erythranthe guttata]|eukprot:XP_012835957.1 PREDICTED: uncharacterized protein LOC105956639 isoform X2 [Erythranthe guttata]
MKGIDIFCASQAATAICLSMEQGSSSSTPSSSAFLLSAAAGDDGAAAGRAIDRHNPIIKDAKRIITKSVLPPCTSSTQPPITPKKKQKKNIKRVPFQETDEEQQNGGKTDGGDDNGGAAAVNVGRKSWRCTTKPGDFISPHGSTRYLLTDKLVSFKDFDTVVEKLSLDDSKTEEELISDDAVPPPPPDHHHQEEEVVVVVLRVSLHCRGCEKKMRKHLSRMEGVTSFEIDFAAKKVTVTGNVTPANVLSSISKVKSNAQLWPSNSIPDNLIYSESTIYAYKEAAALQVADR